MHVKLNVLCARNISFTLITYTNTNTYIRYNTYNNITILPHSICVVLFIAHLLKFELVTMCCVQRSFQFCILLHILIDCQFFIDRLVLQSYFFFFILTNCFPHNWLQILVNATSMISSGRSLWSPQTDFQWLILNRYLTQSEYFLFQLLC